ncbi:uncharacterized protein ACJ7VT_010092 [Polymixia lowei]
MENTDHVYTSTTYDKLNHMEFTYKLNPKELEDFVKLRVSNNYLFSGRRNSSMWAWRAILKHMGLQHKMTHCQAAKKWENLKKKYKELKYPPEGVKVFPEAWPHFTLLDDAVEGRLDGSAPILEAFPRDDMDFLPTSKPKRRKISTMKCASPTPKTAKSEIEVSLNGDDNEEEDEELGRGSEEMELAMQEVENERALLESERATMESERQVLEKEKLVAQRERATLERELASLDRDRASLERERAAIEREKLVMEREKAMLVKDRDAVSRERLALERDRARLERFATDKERTEEVTAESGESSKITDSEAVDRRERFLNLFEKLIENF